jgi:3-hydroxyacyl-CoA dehydrogenase/enoyl-CoA hydratase/3-hydroxybutyryl-CoA epimerase
MAAVTQDVVDGIARLVINVPGKSVNVITRAVRDELASLLDWLQVEREVRAAILISGKPASFIAGADIDEFVALRSRDDAFSLVRGGQVLVDRIESLGKPVVAAIHGACVGGGLEAALACAYRIATEYPRTVLGQPEIQLGLIPAAGGCQRLPRLVGVRAALDIILAGKTLSAKQAFGRGIVDELVHPAVLEGVAMRAAQQLASGWRPRRRGGGLVGLLLDRNPAGRRLVFSRARAEVLKKTRGLYPAPLAALEAVKHGLEYGVQAGLDSEAAHFAELAVGKVSRNLVQVFFATTELKKDPGVDGEVPPPKRIRNVAIVGAGFMGSAIAGVAASRAKADVRLHDTGLQAVAKGLTGAREILSSHLRRGRIDKYEHKELVCLLSGGTDWAGFGRTDLVVEAVFEELRVKREVFRAIEEQVRQSCIIASNTSTIPIARIAEAVCYPERIIGMHFFSPVDKMPLLEVIITDMTAPEVTASAVGFGRAMGKTVIVVNDGPGFWVNRILAPYLNEAGRMLKEGVAVETIDNVMTQFGFPIGPVTLLDEVGLDVVLKASVVLHDAFGDRMKPMDGIGYRHGRKKKVDATYREIIGAAPDASVPEQEIGWRLVYSMLNEAARALDEGVVRSPRDGDIGAVFGIGFPPCHGGPLRYLDAVGPARAVETLEMLSVSYGDRFEPAPRLRQMAESDQRFFTNS